MTQRTLDRHPSIGRSGHRVHDEEAAGMSGNSRTAIVPSAQAADYAEYRFSPGLRVGDTLYISGQVGTDEHGVRIDDPESQFVACFEHIREIVLLGGFQLNDVVELVSYHTSLADLDAFVAVKDRYFLGPAFPAWTAVGITSTAVPGFLVEVKATAVRSS
jgi:enamine deaminase RidA (YjgF/YER057c/UK114 family)